MQFANPSPRRKFLWIFIACFIAVVLSTFIIVPLYKDKNTSDNDEIFLDLIEQSAALQNEFQHLQELNENYATILSDKDFDSYKMKQLDTLNTLINKAEVSFSSMLDSIQGNASSHNQNSFDLFNRIIQSYRSALEESSSINAIRNNLSVMNMDYHNNADSSVLSGMKMKLQEREIENINLSSQLNTSQSNEHLNSPDSFKKFLNQRDTMLDNMLEKQKQKNENLIAYNNKVERENLALKNQLDALINKPVVQNKNQLSEMSAERMNAELNFAKIDCDLSRADAKQIISNSKQRRDLLENALGILNTLSQSDDDYVQQQVKVKMEELKKIAASNHD